MVHTVEIGHGMSRGKAMDFARSQSVFERMPKLMRKDFGND